MDERRVRDTDPISPKEPPSNRRPSPELAREIQKRTGIPLENLLFGVDEEETQSA